MRDAEKAYAEAERLIAEAKATGATELNFDRLETQALEVLPPDIADLTSLTGLWLSDTGVWELGALSGLQSLKGLWLRGTKMSDLSALSGLTSLRVHPRSYPFLAKPSQH